MKRFVSLILSVCFLFSINTVSYAANISSRKASNPVIQSMNDKYHVDFSGMSIDELNKFIDKMKDEDQTRASGNLLNNTQLAWLAAAQIARDKGYECAALMVEFSVYNIDYSESVTDSSTPLLDKLNTTTVFNNYKNNSTFLRWNTFPCSTAVYLLLFDLCHSAPARSCPIFQRRILW